MDTVSLVLAIGAALTLFGGIVQALVAGIELRNHSVQAGQKKQWWAVILICVVLTIIFGGASYASLLKSSNSSRIPNPSATSVPIVASSSPTTLSTSNITKQPTLRPTETPTMQPTPTPILPGTLLYQADWSKGMNGWIGGSSDWATTNNMLVNSGRVSDPDFPQVAATAPFQANGLTDYAVQTSIQYLHCTQGNLVCGFGIFLRWNSEDTTNHGYVGGVDDLVGGWITDIHIDHNNADPQGPRTLKYTGYQPDHNWHTYRFEVKGSDLKLLIDGYEVFHFQDTTYLTSGQTGLECYDMQIEVRSFQIYAI